VVLQAVWVRKRERFGSHSAALMRGTLGTQTSLGMGCITEPARAGCVCVCVCVRARARVCVCVCVYVYEHACDDPVNIVHQDPNLWQLFWGQQKELEQGSPASPNAG
jgi:hypothetical protein